MGLYQWIVLAAGIAAFVAVVGFVAWCIGRASRRPAALHSAAERVNREAPPPPALEAQLRQISELKDRGEIGEADYERRRAALLQRH